MVSLSNIFAGQYATALQQRHTDSLQYQSSRSHSDTGSPARVTTVTASVTSSSGQSSYYQSQKASLTYGPTGVAPAGALDQPESKTQAASNILSFIELQLHRDIEDGATAEELQSRLQAGMEGFIKGYLEASDQLIGAGILSDDVKSAIEKTYTDVMSGIDELAERLNIDSPVERPSVKQSAGSTTDPKESIGHEVAGAVKTPLSESLGQSPGRLKALLDASSVNYKEANNRTFDFTLKTRDGDTVTISASASQSIQASGSGRHLVGFDAASSSEFYFDVEGELDEDEVKAITDLLAQVHDVAETFYNGNLERAFEQALEVGYNSDEIAQFALNLTQVVYQQVEETYGNIAQMPTSGESENSYVETLENNRMSLIGRFVEQLQQAQEFANKLGLGTDMLSQMAEYYLEERQTSAVGSPDDEKGTLLPYVSQVLESLGKLKQGSE